MFNYRYILHVIGLLLVLESLFMLVPLFVSILYGGEDFYAFLFSSTITLICGGLLWVFNQNPEKILENGKATLSHR
ncbi:MAG: hypothetical protein HC830_01555 [Bacteroidetes bacterium]|nr:hypothetical protein [Bacteroidota bacterium]